MKKVLKKIVTFSMFNENYEFEDFTMNDMEDVKEYWNDGANEMYEEDAEGALEFISSETMLDIEKVTQIVKTMLKSGEIK